MFSAGWSGMMRSLASVAATAIMTIASALPRAPDYPGAANRLAIAAHGCRLRSHVGLIGPPALHKRESLSVASAALQRCWLAHSADVSSQAQRGSRLDFSSPQRFGLGCWLKPLFFMTPSGTLLI
jgi:hypothetical protein